MIGEIFYPHLPLGQGLLDLLGRRPMGSPPQVRYVPIEPEAGEAQAESEGGPLGPPRNLEDARRSGALYGQEWGHDAWALAESLGARVHLTPTVELYRMRGWRLDSAQRLFGFCRQPAEAGEPADIYLDATLRPHEQRLTLAHELAHVLWPSDSTFECYCEAWAAAFVGARR